MPRTSTETIRIIGHENPGNGIVLGRADDETGTAFLASWHVARNPETEFVIFDVSDARFDLGKMIVRRTFDAHGGGEWKTRHVIAPVKLGSGNTKTTMHLVSNGTHLQNVVNALNKPKNCLSFKEAAKGIHPPLGGMQPPRLTGSLLSMPISNPPQTARAQPNHGFYGPALASSFWDRISNRGGNDHVELNPLEHSLQPGAGIVVQDYLPENGLLAPNTMETYDLTIGGRSSAEIVEHLRGLLPAAHLVSLGVLTVSPESNIPPEGAVWNFHEQGVIG